MQLKIENLENPTNQSYFNKIVLKMMDTEDIDELKLKDRLRDILNDLDSKQLIVPDEQ